MPKAEVGSTKYIANKQKAKGLQRLRWYCQICQKQCRDENGFKQHTMSEGHVRAALLVGEDPKKYIEDYSRQFMRDFLQLLKTSHGEKKVHMNHFYQEYIRDKEHIHMNATKWSSLTEFAKHLGREGICRVEEGDRGLEIQWIDDSAEAIRRREDIKRKDRLAKGDETLEARLLEKQIAQAREQAAKAGRMEEQHRESRKEGENVSAEPVKVSMNLGAKASLKPQEAKKDAAEDAPEEITEFSSTTQPPSPPKEENDTPQDDQAEADDALQTQPPTISAAPKMSLSLASKAKTTNPLMAKKNPFAKKKDTAAPVTEKKMSNVERIMRDEMDAKRRADERNGSRPFKKTRMD